MDQLDKWCLFSSFSVVTDPCRSNLDFVPMKLYLKVFIILFNESFQTQQDSWCRRAIEI